MLRARLSIPGARSLKDKRRVVKSLKDRIKNGMNVSIAEVSAHDSWQSCELAAVTVAAESRVVQQRLSGLARTLENGRDHLLINISTELL